VILLVSASLTACGKDKDPTWRVPLQDAPTAAPVASGPPLGTQSWRMPTPRPPDAPILTPTPDSPRPLPSLRASVESYTVQAGDTLRQIAARYGVSLDQVAQANQITNPDLLYVGQVLSIPPPTPGPTGPTFKIIPDSELVYGPASMGFNVEEWVRKLGGYLATYAEDVDGQPLNGAQIVQRIAQEYSVNPRLLLSVLQYQSGWLTDPAPKQAKQNYPLGLANPTRKGLYRQLSWAANNLNRGFYLWRVDGVAVWLLEDGSIVPIAPIINAGTAGVQHLFSLLYGRAGWETAVSEQGLFAAYNALFGYPFDIAIEPLLPVNLAQPALQLPFENGVQWAFTSGPHGGWGDGSAWAALDFAPAIEAIGCVKNDDWVVAVADGLVLRSKNGVVILDLDNDGWEQTGWVVLYLHIESRQRVQAGAYLQAGERIGHASCEGGVTTGTHVHLARRFNGEWIPADQGLPFVLDGWVSSGAGVEYDGYLQRGEQRLEAYAGLAPDNIIQR
jgi:murein DD-endopeptidase MepM/ murein hydrolase activator NlpD